jgi:succinyl-CoA synthetase alpha subunit
VRATEGRIGLVSKSGSLTYQMMYELRDIGFSAAVGTTHIDCLQASPKTRRPTPWRRR